MQSHGKHRNKGKAKTNFIAISTSKASKILMKSKLRKQFTGCFKAFRNSLAKVQRYMKKFYTKTHVALHSNSSSKP